VRGETSEQGVSPLLFMDISFILPLDHLLKILQTPNKTCMSKMNLMKLIGILFISISISAFSFKESNTGNSEDPITVSWKFDIGMNATLPEPVFDKSTVFIGTNSGIMFAIDAKTGKKKWQYQAEGAIYSKPSISKDVIFFTSYDGMLYALHTATGKEKWKVKTSPEIKSTPAINNNTVVINDGKKMIALEIETGLELWKKECINFDYFYISNNGKQIFFSDKLLITSLSTSNCNKLWEYKQRIFGMSEFVVDKGTIYISNSDGLFAINDADGKVKWKNKFEEKPPLVNFPRPYPADDIVLFPYLNEMYAFNMPSGTLLWIFKSKTEIKDIISIEDKICFSDNNTNISLLNKNTHKKPQIYVLDNQIASPLYTDKTNVYFINPEGSLCAFLLPELKK
jgi:outer membrane protein assembly factor BamB